MEDSIIDCPTDILIDVTSDHKLSASTDKLNQNTGSKAKNSDNDCPTGILIDVTSDHNLSASTDKLNQNTRSKAKNSDNAPEDCSSIPDTSLFRIKGKLEFFSQPNLNHQELKKDNVLDCPTGILVDLPNSGYNFCHSPQFIRQRVKSVEHVLKESTFEIEVEEDFKVLNLRTSSLNEVSGIHTPTVSPVKPRWKTPSPQSMSRINKEASKIIHILNSSVLFDEDSDEDVFINHEVLPIPINFDFELDEMIEECKMFDNNNTHIDNNEIMVTNTNTVSIQTEDDIRINSNVVELDHVVSTADNSVDDKLHSKEKVCSLQSQLEQNTLSLSDADEIRTSIKGSSTNNDIGSSNTSKFSLSNDGPDDVFECQHSSDHTESHQDKENIITVIKDKLRSCTSEPKNIPFFIKKTRPSMILRNVSNIDHATIKKSYKVTPSHLDLEKTNLLKSNRKTKSNEMPSDKKLPLMKTLMVGQKDTSKVQCSNSFQNDHELVQPKKHNSSSQNASFSAFKSGKKNVNVLSQLKSSFGTPMKRYSICTPVKNSAPSVNSSCSLSTSFKRPSAPKFATPQLGGTSSVIKSKQQLNNTVNERNIYKHQNSNLPAFSKIAKPSSLKPIKDGKESFHKNDSLSFSSQNLDRKAVSTISKRRFSSRIDLPSCLSVPKRKSLVRALFPSV